MSAVIDDHVLADRAGGERYRFETFRTGLLVDDMRYRRDDLGRGDSIPDVELPVLGGGTFAARDLGKQPVLMVFGSRTCPVTESAVPRLARLHDEFGDRIRFVLVNTREAHPGERIPQPMTTGQKWSHAEALRDHHGVRFEVAVDDIDGSLHRRVSPKPNSAYLLRPDGTIVHRAHWANDDADLRRAIVALVDGERSRGRSRAMVRPLLRAVGHLPEIVQAGGPKIERDVWRAAAPLALLARMSRLMPSVALDRRGPLAAVVLVGSATAVVIAAVMLT